MHSPKIPTCLTIALISLLAGCGGGGGGSSDSEVSTSACSTIGLNTKIVNGTACSETASPVVQLLLDLGQGRTGVCSGTMIAPTKVITAAHCFFRRPAHTLVQSGNRTVSAAQVTSHPNVIQRSDSILNDVAIVTLSAPLNVPILPLAIGRPVEEGDVIGIYGFGRSENQSDTNETAGVLRSGEMELTDVNNDLLESVYSGDGSNTCFGDSGGPAVLELNGQPGLVGITSTGTREDCLVGDTSLFTNLQSSSVIDFITSVVPEVGAI